MGFSRNQTRLSSVHQKLLPEHRPVSGLVNNAAWPHSESSSSSFSKVFLSSVRNFARSDPHSSTSQPAGNTQFDELRRDLLFGRA
jgi:hypothetical protein